eukprot:COSAG02_NODE_1629_length_11581_cov_5.858735_3_plen_75_part_00
MGPSNVMLRDSGFKKGLVLVDGDFVTYGAARKVALTMELWARGLLSTSSPFCPVWWSIWAHPRRQNGDAVLYIN